MVVISRALPVGADDDLASFTLTLHLNPEPLAILDLRGYRGVEFSERAIEDSVAPARNVGSPFAISCHLNTILEEKRVFVLEQKKLIPQYLPRSRMACSSG
jgi:hypothetical protein